MRALHVWLGVGALCTLLAAGWLGQKVLGQPEPRVLPVGAFNPPISDRPVNGGEVPIQVYPAYPGSVEVSVSPGLPPLQQTPGFAQGQVPSTMNPQPPPPPLVVPGPNRFSQSFTPPAPPPPSDFGTPSGPSFTTPPTSSSPGPSFSTPRDVRTGKVESSVTTEWVGPAIAKIGQPMACQILVRNNGTAAVHQVVVRHQMPDGVEHRGSEPSAAPEGARQLSWSLGTLEAGQTRTVKVQLVSHQRGSFNCTASVTFASSSALQVQVREPLLVVKVKGPERVIAGEEAAFTITLNNPGDGLTDKIRVTAKLPEGLVHPAGRSLYINDVAPLAPKETRTIRLPCTAKGSGPHTLKVSATAESDLKTEDVAMVEVLNAKLDLAVNGPKLRYIDRHAIYALKINNPGSAPAANVTVTEVIPAGFKFHQASGSGRFDKETHSVTWFVGELQPGQNSEMSLDLVALAPGDHKLVGLVNSARGVKTEAEVHTRVEGLSKLEVEVCDTEDPVEVGAETTYQIKVMNSGTKMESNVQVVCHLPEQLEFTKSRGNMRYRVEGHSIVFDPLPSLAPGIAGARGAEVIYSVTAKGMQPGNWHVRVQVTADSLTEPIMREEVTKFYNDDVPVR